MVTLAELVTPQSRGAAVAAQSCTRRWSGFETAGLWVKAESLQPIGSFKLRGAFNAVAQLMQAQRAAA